MNLSKIIRQLPLLAALLVAAGFHLQAQNIDTVVFGDPQSEAAHHFDAHFPPATPVDKKYTNPPASEPSENPPSDVIDGAMGLKARQLLSRSPVADINGGEITITMKVDPVNQNYFSVKFWGSDSNPGLIILYCNGYELGARHGLEATGLSFMLNEGAWLKGRFWYRTVRLPLYLTYGHQTASISLRWTGNLNYYNNSSYVHYQDITRQPSQPLYAAYTHVGSYVDTKGEVEAPPPPAPPIRTQPGPEAIDHFKDDLNHNLKDRLHDVLEQKNPNDLPKDSQFLAQCYGINWTTGYNNSEIVDRVVKIGDFLTTFYSTKNTVPGEGFGSNTGPFGNAVKLLWDQLQDKMSDTVDFGGKIGQVTRGEGWGKLLRASIDDQRFDRKKIYNQECDGDFQLYMANQGLQLVDPDLALTEPEALRYVKEGMGILPWAGNDQPNQPGSVRPVMGTYPNGPNWYTSTSRGTLKDGSYMPTGDYGEQGPAAYQMWLLTKDEQIHARAIQIEKARLPFRFPTVDDGGFKVMTVSEPIGSRNKGLPGHDAYLTRDSGAVLVASENIPEFTGVFQEEIEDGQLYAFAVKQPINRYFGPYMPDQLAAGLAQPASSYRLPMADGQPDFAWGDEDNMVVAAKHGNERFFAALARDFVNGAAIVFEITPQQAYLGDVQEDDVQFISNGNYVVPNGWVEQWDWAQPPDNDLHPNAFKGRRQPEAIRPDMVGVDLASYNNQDGGRARSYTLRYGHFLVGMNMDARYNKLPYRVKTPSDFTSGIDLVSGQNKTAPVVIPPGTTVVFYLPSTSSPNPPPASPLVFTGLPGNNLVNLDWDPSSGAQSYAIGRSETAGGPYAVIASGLKTLQYVDKTAESGKTYYYVLTGKGVTGESDPSPELKIILPDAGSTPAPWLDQDIGKVNKPGSANLDGTTFTLTAAGGDIYQAPDSFHYTCQPVTGDCTITAQVTRQQGNEWSKSGLMFRSSLAPNATMAALIITPQHGAQWIRRGDGYQESEIPDARTPIWLRLSRHGTMLTASTSTDGANWTAAGTQDMPQLFPTIYTGLAAASHDNSTQSTTTFENVSVTTP
jgi:regulation of enolase protein 1 (concanavalin A-like superfamily)